MKKKWISLIALCGGLVIPNTILAGNLQTLMARPLPPSQVIPSSLSLSGHQAAFLRPPTLPRPKSELDEGLPKRRTTEVDDDLDVLFDQEQEDKIDAPLSPAGRCTTDNPCHITLEWDEAAQKVRGAVSDWSPINLMADDTGSEDDAAYRVDEEITGPKIEQVYYDPRLKRHFTGVQTGSSESEDNDSDTESSNSAETTDEDNDVENEGESCSSGGTSPQAVTTHSLRNIQLASDKSDKDFYLYIGNSHLLADCNLTERGAVEIQAENPNLFATTEEVRDAFNVLNKNTFERLCSIFRLKTAQAYNLIGQSVNI